MRSPISGLSAYSPAGSEELSKSQPGNFHRVLAHVDHYKHHIIILPADGGVH